MVFLVLFGVVCTLFFSILHIIIRFIDNADQRARERRTQRWIDEGNLDAQLRERWNRE